ncbi:hypothetical protein IWZ03DRAFT_440248 [Phyllosticta citriasiana]|uniref:Uncharacterized protein n=1 Tax=Phyllosticta citriasiana TaxID=595635 RepID=A0ABR1KN90_9PEZI
MSCPNRNFVDITVHTARCGDCNARNTSLLKRCPQCGHQQCLTCHEMQNGAHGMYLMNRSNLPVPQSNQGLSDRAGGSSSTSANPRPDKGEVSTQGSKKTSRKRSAPKGEPVQATRKKRVVGRIERTDVERQAAGDAERQRPGVSQAPISIRSSSSSPDLFVSAPALSVAYLRPETIRSSSRSAHHHGQRGDYRPPSPSLPTTSPLTTRLRPNVRMAPSLGSPFSGRPFERDGSVFDDAAHQDRRGLPAHQSSLENGDGVVQSIEIYEDPPALNATSLNSALVEGQENAERHRRDLSASTIVDEYTPTVPTHYRADSTPEPIPATFFSPTGPLMLQDLPVERRDTSASNFPRRHRRSSLDLPGSPPQHLREDQNGSERRSSPGSKENEDPASFLNGHPSSESTQLASPDLRQSPTPYVVTRPWPSTADQQPTRALEQTNEMRRNPSSDTEEELVERRSRRVRISRVVLDDEDDGEDEGESTQSQVQPLPNIWSRRVVVEEEPAHHTAMTSTPAHRSTPSFSTAKLRPRDSSSGAYNHRATRSGRFAPRQREQTPTPPNTTMSTPRPSKADPAPPTPTHARPGTYEAIEEQLDKVPFDEAHYRQPRPPLPPFVGLDKLKPSNRASVIAYREQYERERQQEIADFDAWRIDEDRKWEEKRLAEYRRRRRAAGHSRASPVYPPQSSAHFARSRASPAHPPQSLQSAGVSRALRFPDPSSESGMVISKGGIVYSALRDLPLAEKRPRADPRKQMKKLMKHLPGQDWDWETYGRVHGALHLDNQLPPERRHLSPEEREEAEKVLLDMIPNTLLL